MNGTAAAQRLMFLEKPYTPASLAGAVREALAGGAVV
jgi:hypothetical protein